MCRQNRILYQQMSSNMIFFTKQICLQRTFELFKKLDLQRHIFAYEDIAISKNLIGIYVYNTYEHRGTQTSIRCIYCILKHHSHALTSILYILPYKRITYLQACCCVSFLRHKEMPFHSIYSTKDKPKKLCYQGQCSDLRS